MATMTAALAIVRDRQGNPIANIRSLRLNESIQRGSVRGLGTLKKKEVPAVAIDCTASFDFNMVDLIETGVPGGFRRDINSYKEFEEDFLLAEGTEVQIFKKVQDLIDPATGLRKVKPLIFATLTDLFIDQDGVDINEGQVASNNQSYQYLTPVLIKQ